MNNTVSDLIYVQDLKYTNNGNIMYMNWETEEEKKYSIKKTIRDLKVGELVYDEDNSERLEELVEQISYDDYIPTLSTMSKTLNINLDKKIHVQNNDELNEANDYLKDLVLTEIYNIASSNKVSIQRKHSINFDINLTGQDYTTKLRKLLSKMLQACTFIAAQCRIGPGNVIVMNSKYAYFLSGINDNYTPGQQYSISGMIVIIDDKIGDKIIVSRKPSDSSQIQNSVILSYRHDEDNNLIFYSIDKTENCEYNYIEINVVGLDY